MDPTIQITYPNDWNVHGIGNDKTLRSLRHHLRRHKVQLICLIEPKISVDRVEEIRTKLHFDFACTNQDEDAKIWLLWQSAVSILILQRNMQSITVQVQHGNNMEHYATYVYASCLAAERRYMYDGLSQLGASFTKPWMIGGDFNAILSPEEK